MKLQPTNASLKIIYTLKWKVIIQSGCVIRTYALTKSTTVFHVQESVHHEYMSVSIQRDATTSIHSLFISVNSSTCLGWYLHPSCGAHIKVFTAVALK
jgi:hypothetical protein